MEFLQDFGPLSPLAPDVSGLSVGARLLVSADGESYLQDSLGVAYYSLKVWAPFGLAAPLSPCQGNKENSDCSDRGICDPAIGGIPSTSLRTAIMWCL